MCGICGIAGHGLPASEVEHELLPAMQARMVHRGPDEEGRFADPLVGLASRRLSIIDLSTGRQPLFNEDRSLVLVCNGEIYNFQSLRPRLEAAGHRFATGSDCEVIPHLYEEYGLDFAKHLRGMFALALWDSQARRLILARDRIGKKPLYYHHDGRGRLVFGSELKVVLAAPGVPRELDLLAVHHYLTLQYVPEPLTALTAVKKLQPGHLLVWSPAGQRDEADAIGHGASAKGPRRPADLDLTTIAQNLRQRRYWQPAVGPVIDAPPAERRTRLVSLIEEAVRLRLVSDVPLGCWLSGGIDSAIVAGLMSRASARPVQTYTIGLAERRFDERAAAAATARHFGTAHHEEQLALGPADVDLLPKLVAHFDEPFADTSAIPLWHISRLTRGHVTVVLSGDGGDELFGGYPRYWLDPWADLAGWLPRPLIAGLTRLARQLPDPKNLPITLNWIAGLHRLDQVASTPRDASIIRWGSYFTEDHKWQLYAGPLQPLLAQPTARLLLDVAAQVAGAPAFVRSQVVDLLTYAPGDYLVKSDRMSMAHSLEVRCPLLDQQVVEYALRLPVADKLGWWSGKRILRQAFADLLPPHLFRLPKRGFSIPIGLWMTQGKLDAWLDELLGPAAVARRGLFAPTYVAGLLAEQRGGRVDHGRRLWTLLFLEQWQRQYLDAPAGTW